MARRELLSAVALLAAGLVLVGCASGSDGSTDSPMPSGSQSALTEEGATDTDSAATDGATANPATRQDAFSDGVDELRDGVWQIGDAGEVEFAFSNGDLSLTGVRPAEGWHHRVSDDDADELQVNFTRGTTEWKFEVEIDDSTMEISKELTLTSADAGTYLVGSAGEVSFDSDGSTVTTGEVTAREGWTVVTRDESSTDIEIEFRDDRGGKAEFEVEVRSGDLEVEIHQKFTGPVPD